MARSHVPKFGNWDGDNVPYTAYFENARKEKISGIKINPNDPEQNPEAFNIGSSNFSHAESYDDNHHRNIYDQRKNTSRKTMASESSSDKSPSDNSVSSVLKPNHQRKKSDRNKYTSRSHIPRSPGPNNYDDEFSYRSVSVPKFGEWDEKDPRSGDGFTVIFNKVKEEKQIAASKFPPLPTNNYDQTSQKKETKSKV
ncbi:hypothetical protein BUALT_Bualt03G0079900 [Buddleja alternifolia]|uniref:RIN4 pathogenic type III effector avirulence factor Avr cleavage site domain-containing protein n=1 Tax=Buddleja alternifolia TaxID=168488 RepID=A0AAV6XYR5_9LAMI|nr:hypothetical protein BUALT_Bualt03G0079900 [Buddleja alternifolia]